MAIFNMIPYGIRVILDKRMHQYIPEISAPIGIEGTVLSISTYDPECEYMIKKGDILNVLFNTSFPLSYDVKVRWDNDVKHTYIGSGMLAFRSGGKGLYSNIWNKEELSIDETPFHELKPYTKGEQHTRPLLNTDYKQMKLSKYKYAYIGSGGKGRPLSRGANKINWAKNPFTDIQLADAQHTSIQNIPINFNELELRTSSKIAAVATPQYKTTTYFDAGHWNVSTSST